MTHWNTYQERKEIPIVCGVYCMYKDNSLIYIGQSNNIRKRFSNHSIQDWDYVKIKPMTTKGACIALEERLVKRLQPSYNALGSNRPELGTRHRITIDHNLYCRVRSYCSQNNFKIKDFINEILTSVFKGMDDAKQSEN